MANKAQWSDDICISWNKHKTVQGIKARVLIILLHNLSFLKSLKIPLHSLDLLRLMLLILIHKLMVNLLKLSHHFNIQRVEYFAHWVAIKLNCNYSYKKSGIKTLFFDNEIYNKTEFNIFEPNFYSQSRFSICVSLTC